MAATNSTDIGMTDDFAVISRRKRKNKNRLMLILALLAVAAALWWYWQKTHPVVEADEPLIATVEVGSIENTIASSGTLKPSRLIEVGAQVSGQLQKLHVQV